jgi:pSer/pThr/pTyr-binding forkhead associated (FHA) protein
MPSLHVLRGPNVGAVFTVGDMPVVLGRNPDCDVPIPTSSVSRRHARIIHVGDRHFIEDLLSRNGTWLNNVIVLARTPLKNNDRIRICDFIAAFLDQAPTSVTVEDEDLEPLDDLTGPIAMELPIPAIHTERHWLDCTDPWAMLDFLAAEAKAERVGLFCARADSALTLAQFAPGEASCERKFRLFTCACARRIWHLLSRPASRKGVEVAERFADDEATEEELAEARTEMTRGSRSESIAAYHAVREDDNFAHYAAEEAVRAVEADRGTFWQERREAERAAQAGLLRDLFRPFRPVAVDPAWLHWEGGLIPQLAGAAYEQRCLPGGTLEPDRLRVLADALEDAGCACADLLAHLRGPGTHVRGCWAIDLLR